jgi:lipopolysaccharide transport system permease protein
MTKQIKDLPVKVYKRRKKANFFLLIKETLTDLYKSHFLALQFAKRDISSQYRQSYLGIIWLFLTPIASAGVWIFLNSSGTINVPDTGLPYPVYVFSGTLIWSILLEAINSPITSTNGSRNILSKINFPKEALILSGVYKLLFNSSVKILLLLVFVFVFDVRFHWSLLWFPLVLLASIMVGTAIGLLITPIGLLYTDVSRLITMLLSLVMYVTPVVYSMPQSGIMNTMMSYNPFTPLVTTIRAVVVGQPPEFLNYFLGLTGFGALLFIISLVIYRVSIPVIVERLSA